MKKLLILLLFSASLLYAEEGYINYMDGYAYIQEGDSWQEIYEGDDIFSSDTIMLEDDSYAEIKFGNSLIKLSRPGTYYLESILKNANSVNKSGLGAKTKNIFTKLTSGGQDFTQSQYGGARAQNIDDILNKMENTGQGVMEDALSAYEDGDMKKAYFNFEEALEYSDDSDQALMASYYLSLISFESGDILDALQIMDDAELDDEAFFYGLVIYMKAQLLIDINAYQDALNWIEENETEEDDPINQGLAFLQGMANLLLSNDSDADDLFELCIELDPESDFAKEAENLLSN